MMIVFLVLMGLAGGGYHPSAAPLISASVEPKNQGRALGFHLIGGSGSFFLAPLIAAAIATVWGWRGSFIGLAVPAAIFGIILYILLGRRAEMGKPREIAMGSYERTPASQSRWRRITAFMVLTIFTQAVTFSTIAFIPLFIVDNFGIAEEAAAAFLAIVYSAGLWASPLGGYLSDRLGRIPVVVVVCLLSGPLIYLLNIVPYGAGIGVLLLFIGIAMYIRMPAAESFIIGRTPVHRRSTILGIYYFSAMEAGGILAPVMGSFIDRFGFHVTFSIAGGAVVLVTLICMVFLWGSRD
jgi:predicted MFS family arabinose efflux permease